MELCFITPYHLSLPLEHLCRLERESQIRKCHICLVLVSLVLRLEMFTS